MDFIISGLKIENVRGPVTGIMLPVKNNLATLLIPNNPCNWVDSVKAWTLNDCESILYLFLSTYKTDQ